jgi:hypothetical protein
MATGRIVRVACTLALTAATLTSCGPAAGSQTTIGVEETRRSRLELINADLYPDTEAVPPKEAPSRLQRIDEVFYPATPDTSDCRVGKPC